MEKEISSQYELFSLKVGSGDNYQIFKINKITGQVWHVFSRSSQWIEEEVKPDTSKE